MRKKNRDAMATQCTYLRNFVWYVIKTKAAAGARVVASALGTLRSVSSCTTATTGHGLRFYVYGSVCYILLARATTTCPIPTLAIIIFLFSSYFLFHLLALSIHKYFPYCFAHFYSFSLSPVTFLLFYYPAH